ncbi:MAG: DUF4984 domain-containing protein [Alistipes sp.]|nr:DUF4984 domain-containing protein [Alistipes sp.]
MNIKHLAIIGMAFALLACNTERTTYNETNFILFSAEEHTLGVIDSQKWFEIPITATRTADYNRNVGVEVIASESSAIEGLHFIVESNTVTIPAGKLTTALRIKGMAENIPIDVQPKIILNLVINEEETWDVYGTRCEVTLQRCCPFDINNFAGYAKITSTWLMQYMNTDSRLVETEVDAATNTLTIKSMFYEGYDIKISLDDSDPLAPRVIVPEEQVLGSTGEAFGTIYGNGKLMMSEPSGYTSYYGTCENFMVLYSMMYVDNVGTVGTFVNIFEWISKEEAERIMREGF